MRKQLFWSLENVLHWHMTNYFLWTRNHAGFWSLLIYPQHTHSRAHFQGWTMCVPLLWSNSFLVEWCFVPCPCLGQHTRGKLAEAWNMCLAVVIEISLATTDQWEQLCLPLPTFWSWTGFGGIFLVNSEIEWASNPCVHRTDLAPSWNTNSYEKFSLLYNKSFFFLFFFPPFCCSTSPFSFSV